MVKKVLSSPYHSNILIIYCDRRGDMERKFTNSVFVDGMFEYCYEREEIHVNLPSVAKIGSVSVG
jgi:hypothetical protein